MTDHASLIKQCANGKQAALKQLMETEGRRMLGVGRRMLRRQDLAEDAVQESFVLIWQKASQFDDTRGSAKGWIYTILRNKCLTILRNTDRETEIEAAASTVAEDEAVLEAAYNRLDQNADLRRCLDKLDRNKRLAILSCYIFGHSHGELAGKMNLPLGSVKAWVRRGLKILRECMT